MSPEGPDSSGRPKLPKKEVTVPFREIRRVITTTELIRRLPQGRNGSNSPDVSFAGTFTVVRVQLDLKYTPTRVP